MAWASKRGARPRTRSSTGLPSITGEGCIRPWTTRAPWRSRKIGVASKKHWRHKSGAMGGAARGQGYSEWLQASYTVSKVLFHKHLELSPYFRADGVLLEFKPATA